MFSIKCYLVKSFHVIKTHICCLGRNVFLDCHLSWVCPYLIFISIWKKNNFTIIAPNKVLFFNQNVLIFFLFLHTKISCGYSSEAPHWGASNENSPHIFLWSNKKNIMWIPLLSGAITMVKKKQQKKKKPHTFGQYIILLDNYQFSVT